MSEPSVDQLLSVFEIPIRACGSEFLAPLDEDKEQETLCESYQTGNNKRILQAHIDHPGRNAVFALVLFQKTHLGVLRLTHS